MSTPQLYLLGTPDIVHWREGKAIEIWHYGDWMGWVQQFGVIPPLG